MTDAAPPPAAPPPAAPAVRALNCPNCGGAIEMRTAGYAVSLICPHCGSTLDATDPALKLIETAQAALRRPRIALGTRGALDGADWDAVGYLERSSEDGGWAEYLLFNPYRGYRWLVDDGERFSFGQVLDRAPTAAGEHVLLDGKTFGRVEEPYPATVDFVVGEFPWRARVGETVSVTDHARSGATLSAEANANERTWTLLRQLDRGVAERAFGIAPAAAMGGMAAAGDRSPYEAWLKPLLMVAACAVAALLFAATVIGPSRKVLLRQEVSLVLDAPERTVVMGPIVVDRPRSALTVHSETGALDNAWVDLDYSLVNRATQARYDAYGLAEEYHGRDSDGSWREGDASPRTRFASIPRGSYDLVLEASAHRWAGGARTAAASRGASYTSGPGSSGDGFSFSFTYGDKPAAVAPPPPADPPVALRVTVRRGANFAGNFWLAFWLVVAVPAWVLFLHVRHAIRRNAA